jgi:RNA polymerase sigma factor (TIGR02999 family)
MPNQDVTFLLQNLGKESGYAADELLPLVYHELRRIAAARMQREAAGHTLQPTALVHEAWLRLVGEADRTWRNRAYFFAAASECMRRILIENARRKASLKRGGHLAHFHLEELADDELAQATPDEKLLVINEAVERLERSDPDLARVVIMKFFGGMTNQEVGEHLNVTERTVERHWAFARARLLEIIHEEF